MNKVTIDGKQMDGVTVNITTNPTIPPVTPPVPPPVTPPPPSGILGSKTNPIPINKDAGQGYFYPSTGGPPSGCQVSVAGKVYFLDDPPAYASTSYLIIKGYNNTTLKYWRQLQDKAGNDIGGEVSIRNYTGDGYDTQLDRTNDFSTHRFLYAVEGFENALDIYVQFLP